MTDRILNSKMDIRTRMVERRGKMNKSTKAAYDAEICRLIWEMVEQHEFQTIHTYLPIRSEIDVMPLIRELLHHSMSVFTSRTLDNGQLEHLHLNSLDELAIGKFGVPYPANTPAYHGSFDLIIVPGLAFDQDNYRLGYGGGYYDRFLVEHPLSYKLGVSYAFQIMEQLPLEAHDAFITSVEIPN